MSAVATALNFAGRDLAQGTDFPDGVSTNLWFAGGFLSCLFWVRFFLV